MVSLYQLRLAGSKLQLPGTTLVILLDGHSGNLTVCSSNVPVRRKARRSGPLVWTGLKSVNESRYQPIDKQKNDTKLAHTYPL